MRAGNVVAVGATRPVAVREIVAAGVIVAGFIPLYASGSVAFAGLGLAAVVAGAALCPPVAVAAVPATLAAINMPARTGHLEFSPTEILVVATAAGVGLRAMATLVTGRAVVAAAALRRFAGLCATGVGATSLALLAVGTLSLFTVADPSHRHESLRLFRWVIAEPVLYAFLARWFLGAYRDRALAAVLYVGAAAAAAAWALVELARGAGLVVEGVVRISGTYPHPNALALYLERPLPFAVAMALAFSQRPRLRWLVPAGVCGLALLLTFSRGAWIGAGLAVLAVTWLGGRRRLAAAFAALEVLAGLAFTALYARRLLNLFHGGSGSLRVDIWTSAVAMIRDHPIFGVGLDQFLYQYAPRYVLPPAWSERFTSHPHDIVLDVWLSLGIMGLILATAIVAVVTVKTRRVIVQRHRLGLAAAGALLAGGIHGLVDNGYFLPDLALAFWFFMAIIDIEAGTRPGPVAPDGEDEGV